MLLRLAALLCFPAAAARPQPSSCGAGEPFAPWPYVFRRSLRIAPACRSAKLVRHNHGDGAYTVGSSSGQQLATYGDGVCLPEPVDVSRHNKLFLIPNSRDGDSPL